MASNDIRKPWIPGRLAPDLTFINANLIDVEEGCVITDCTIRIRNGFIVSVSTDGSRGMPQPESPSGTRVIDLQNHYVCPGLIDCHVHLTATPGGVSLGELFNASPNTIAHRTSFVAREMLLRGFTTARDTGGADASLRDAIAEGLLPGPRLFIAGKALSQTGGHGDSRANYQGEQHKCCGGHSPALSRLCNGVSQCLEAARDELRQGANFLKIMTGGGVASPSDALDMLQFTAEEIQAITTTAAYSKTYVTAHAYTVGSIRHAVDNGVRGIEHANLIDRETAEYCVKKGVIFTPTLVAYHGMMEPPFDKFLDEFGRKKNREVLASGLNSLKILRDAGATICYGSDLLGGLHSLQNREFTIRSAALSPQDILRSATINGARTIGMENQLGCVKSGAIADLLILAANPLEDISVLDNIQRFRKAIIKDGRVVTSRLKDLSVDALYDPFQIQDVPVSLEQDWELV
ncbi:imidazolonepropionase [Xylogone sp. PMI_703]|nr:imidazolonepropionase [Xylogone sp. PMI_703]